MLDALQEAFAVVVLGFPDNGRTTLHGIHYVGGVPLAESQFRNDPVHPMTKSSLREILQAQTGRRVDNIWYEVYDGGLQNLRRAVEEKRKEGGYCIMDVRDNRDLQLLAEALQGEKILCGSSALSEYLARLQTSEFAGDGKDSGGDRNGACPSWACPSWARPGCMDATWREKVLGLAGSLMPQTAAQTEYMRERGYQVLTLDTRLLLEPDQRRRECERILQAAEKAYQETDFVMIRTAQDPDVVKETKSLGQQRGIGNVEISVTVSGTLSEIARHVIETQKIRGILVCGGDTSASICEHLGIRGMQVLEEIETGLPLCESVGLPHYRLVLKSGSFGSREFVERALQILRGYGA